MTQRGTLAESTASPHLFRAACKNAWRDVHGRRIEKEGESSQVQNGSTFYIVSVETRPALSPSWFSSIVIGVHVPPTHTCLPPLSPVASNPTVRPPLHSAVTGAMGQVRVKVISLSPNISQFLFFLKSKRCLSMSTIDTVDFSS